MCSMTGRDRLCLDSGFRLLSVTGTGQMVSEPFCLTFMLYSRYDTKKAEGGLPTKFHGNLRSFNIFSIDEQQPPDISMGGVWG